MERADQELGRTAKAGISLVSCDDPAYLQQLKQIYDPPLVLYLRGNSEVISKPGIAMVGTLPCREMSRIKIPGEPNTLIKQA